MQYDIVWHERMTEFIKLVNTSLKDGWQLQGGILRNEAGFYQVMFKHMTEI